MQWWKVKIGHSDEYKEYAASTPQEAAEKALEHYNKVTEAVE